MKLKYGPFAGKIENPSDKENPTLFKLSVYERDWKNTMPMIEELPHNGRSLNPEMVRAIVDKVNTDYKLADHVVETYVRPLGEPEYFRANSFGQKHQEAQKGPSPEPEPKQPFYHSIKKELTNPEEKPTKYIQEEAGLKGEKPEIIVLSNSRDNEGRNVRQNELEIAQQLAEEKKIPLKEMRLFVQQDEGEYRLRTFREYSIKPAQDGEPGRTTIQQNYKDQEGSLYTRQEVAKFLANAQEQAKARERVNDIVIDLSQESLGFDR